MNNGALGQDPNQFREMWSHPTWRQKDGEDPRIPWEVGGGVLVPRASQTGK